MKKNLLSIAAVVIAVLLVAFTQPATNTPQTDMYVFEFDHTQAGGYSLSNVENESSTYWKYIGKNLALCDNEDLRACRVSVTGAYVNSTSTPTELLNVVITAEESDPGIAYITEISAPMLNQFSNKE